MDVTDLENFHLPPHLTTQDVKNDAGDRQSMERQAKDTSAKESDTKTDGLGDDGRDAVDTTSAKGAQPRTLDKATAVRVQQWWNDTQEGGGLRILSDLSESREEKLAQQYADRARAAYDQKYGIRPDEVGLPHRRTPSARWGGQDFVEAKKEAEALGDNEMLQAINEIERTNIELKAVKDIDSRAREDSARELKELFPEYAEAIDADLRGLLRTHLTKKWTIEPNFTPESKPKSKVTLYRGLNRKDIKNKLAPRGIMVPTNRDVAASYSGSDGEVVPFTVDAKEIIEFPVGRTFDKTIDRRAKSLKAGQVLVARNGGRRTIS